MSISIRIYLAGQALAGLTGDLGLGALNQEELEIIASRALEFADILCVKGEIDGTESAFPSSGGVTIVTDGDGGGSSPSGRTLATSGGFQRAWERAPAPAPVEQMAISVYVNGSPYSTMKVPMDATKAEIMKAIELKHPLFAETNRKIHLDFAWDDVAKRMSLTFSQ